MPFLLLGVRGPVAGVVRRITEDGPLTLGRDPSNQFCLPDAAVSRRHCTLVLLGDRLQVRDLGSFNGTFVNGSRAGEALVGHDDEIRLGTCVLRVVDERFDSDPDSQGATEASRTTEATAAPDGPYELHRLARRLQTQESNRRELGALLELASVLPSLTSFAEAKRCFFEVIFRTLPVEQAALFLADPASGELCASYGWKRGCGPAPPLRIFPHSVARCMEEEAGMDVDIGADGGTAWLCPLPCNAGVTGALAVSPTQEGELKLRDRQWLCAAMRLAGGLLANLHEIERLRRANQQLAADLHTRGLIIGDSPAIAAVKSQILKAASSEATVLITGETGVGKELVAQALHAFSSRARGPFVAINCAALSPALLESDLFGHERGAFTGAVALKRGRIETAAGGTLFLDEIGELEPGIQAKLLRVLQEREFERVGGLARHRADIRLVAATNRYLAGEVERGAFRKDLYYRIKVVTIHVPPLRERRADIPLLAAHLLSTCSVPAARRILGFSPGARRRLMAYEWPGNVRELQNAIEHAVVFSSGEWIEAEDLPESLLEAPGADAGPEAGYYTSLRDAKRRIILSALAECGGSQQEAAKKLGLHPSHLSRLIRNLGLRPEAGSMR